MPPSCFRYSLSELKVTSTNTAPVQSLVVLVVSSEGIRIVEQASRDILAMVWLQDIVSMHAYAGLALALALALARSHGRSLTRTHTRTRNQPCELTINTDTLSFDLVHANIRIRIYITQKLYATEIYADVHIPMTHRIPHLHYTKGIYD